MSFLGNLTQAVNNVATNIGKMATAPATGTATTTATPLNAFEQSFNSQYVGCYRDNPSQPYMTHELPNVTNIETCINNAKNLGYRYASISNGNKCRASNQQDFTKGESVDRGFCSTKCAMPNSGNCGGTYFNQVYNTGIVGNEKFGLINANGDYLTYFLVIIVIILLYYEMNKRHVF